MAGKSYFDENYPDYDAQNSQSKISFYLNLLNKWLPKNSHLFELGTGLGNFLSYAQKNYKCCGCDPNEYAVQKTKKITDIQEILLGSYNVIPNKEWDAIVSWDVVEHIPKMEEAISTINQRLKVGGLFFMVVPVYDGILSPITKMLDKDPTHLWKISRYDWLEYLKKNRFEIVEKGGIIRKLITRNYYFHMTRPQTLLWPTGSAAYYIARKTE